MEKITKTNENSVVNFIITKKETWFGMSPFEIFLFIAGMATMIALPIFLKGTNGYAFDGNPFDSNWLDATAGKYNTWDLVLTFAAAIGIAGALMLSTKNKHAWIILLIEAILYGSNSFFALGSFALGSINMFVVPVILVISHFFSWKGNSNGVELETKKLGSKDMAIVVSGVLVLTGALGSMFIYGFGAGSANNWIDWIDALMGSIMAIAFILSALRYRETFVVFLISNIVKVLAWTIVIGIDKDTSFATSLTLAWVYLLNAIFGLLIWKHSKETTLKSQLKIK